MKCANRLFQHDVTPLQVWDLALGDGRKFWEVVSARRVAALRESGASAQLIADVVADGIKAACHALPAGFAGVYLCGGLSRLVGLRRALRRADWPFVLSRMGRDYALQAKRCLFGFESMIVIDVGQTAIKVFLPNDSRLVFPRDPELIPFGRCPDKGDRAVAFIRAVVRGTRQLAPTASVLLSLPAPVDANLVPGETSYGFAGRRTFISEIFDGADCPVFVANDAELGAACAKSETNIRPLLVLSLGLGPGGALIRATTP